MTDAQSRTYRPRIVQRYSDMQVRVFFSSCSEASRFCKATNGSNFTIDPVAQSSHPAPQRDEHITRMLDQLSGGVGTFLQGDGVKLAEYVRGLEQERSQLDGILSALDIADTDRDPVTVIEEWFTSIAALRRHLAERDRRLSAIVAWNMPYEGYGGHWGCNGERDYIISVARGNPEWIARPKEPKP